MRRGSTMNKLEWTEPHEGVQHLKGLPAGWQITVEDRGSYAVVYELHLRGSKPFTALREESTAMVEQARRIGENWAVKLRDEWEVKP